MPLSAPPDPAAPPVVPILMYHYVRHNPDPADRIGYNLSVTPENFAGQMELLVARGYQSISLEEYYRSRQGEALPPRPVVITFDDGYADAYTSAYPVLRQHGLRATFFIITSLVDRPGYLDWGQVGEMAQAGMEIGAHTVRHPDLTTLSPSALAFELGESRRRLEEALGTEIAAVSYPSGRHNRTVLAAAAEAGYRVAVTTEWGRARAESELLRLPRLRVQGGTTLLQFGALLP